MASSLKGFAAQLDLLADNVAALESSLKLLMNRELDDVLQNLSALEYAQLNVVLAFASTAIYFALLKAQGVDPANHPIKSELDRVRLYMKKVNTRLLEADDAQSTRPFSLDKSVAKRIVTFHTSQNEMGRSATTARSSQSREEVETEEGEISSSQPAAAVVVAARATNGGDDECSSDEAPRVKSASSGDESVDVATRSLKGGSSEDEPDKGGGGAVRIKSSEGSKRQVEQQGVASRLFGRYLQTSSKKSRRAMVADNGNT